MLYIVKLSFDFPGCAPSAGALCRGKVVGEANAAIYDSPSAAARAMDAWLDGGEVGDRRTRWQGEVTPAPVRVAA